MAIKNIKIAFGEIACPEAFEWVESVEVYPVIMSLPNDFTGPPALKRKLLSSKIQNWKTIPSSNKWSN